MKKFGILFFLLFSLLLMGCEDVFPYMVGGVVFHKPNNNLVPKGFVFQAEAGNGWYLYASPVGYFLVSIQGYGGSGPFVEMTWIGTELKQE
jgi:hypothetical protein